MHPISIIGLISFAPAIFLLYKVLGDREAYFKHNKAFFMVALGMVVGMFVGPFSIAIPLHIFLWTLALVVLIELTKFIVLMTKPFRLKHDSTYYGMAMGIGIGPMMVFLYGYFAALMEISLKTALFIGLLSVSYTFIHAATGAFIGFGCYKGEFWRYFTKAVIVSGLHGLVMSIVWGGHFSETGNFALTVVASLFSVTVMLYIVFEILPKTIPDRLKKIESKKV